MATTSDVTIGMNVITRNGMERRVNGEGRKEEEEIHTVFEDTKEEETGEREVERRRPKRDDAMKYVTNMFPHMTTMEVNPGTSGAAPMARIRRIRGPGWYAQRS